MCMLSKWALWDGFGDGVEANKVPSQRNHGCKGERVRGQRKSSPNTVQTPSGQYNWEKRVGECPRLSFRGISEW